MGNEAWDPGEFNGGSGHGGGGRLTGLLRICSSCGNGFESSLNDEFCVECEDALMFWGLLRDLFK